MTPEELQQLSAMCERMGWVIGLPVSVDIDGDECQLVTLLLIGTRAEVEDAFQSLPADKYPELDIFTKQVGVGQ